MKNEEKLLALECLFAYLTSVNDNRSIGKMINELAEYPEIQECRDDPVDWLCEVFNASQPWFPKDFFKGCYKEYIEAKEGL